MTWLVTRTLTVRLSDQEVEAEREPDETPADCARALAGELDLDEWDTVVTQAERVQ